MKYSMSDINFAKKARINSMSDSSCPSLKNKLKTQILFRGKGAVQTITQQRKPALNLRFSEWVKSKIKGVLNMSEIQANKINSMSISTAILIGCLICGSFYYAAEIRKQNSTEKREQAKIDKENRITAIKSICNEQSVKEAIEVYKINCESDCKKDFYNIDVYGIRYKHCLLQSGI